MAERPAFIPADLHLAQLYVVLGLEAVFLAYTLWRIARRALDGGTDEDRLP